MTRILIAASCLALAACGSNEAEAPVTDTTATDVAATPMATPTATGPNASAMAGTYEMQMADGTTVRQSLNPDGTYAYSDMQGSQTEGGMWRQNGAQLCLDPQGAEPETCYTGGQPGADGTFALTDAQGNQVGTVRKTGNAGGNNMAPAS